MDDLVRAALMKWPDVPACRGWLGLDARGDWYLRDERAQRAGASRTLPMTAPAPLLWIGGRFLFRFIGNFLAFVFLCSTTDSSAPGRLVLGIGCCSCRSILIIARRT